MKNAITYLTRRCPRNCSYCSIRDAKDVGPELSTEQWKEVFSIYQKMGCTFNIVLGNEPWLLGSSLLDIFKDNKVPFGLYTSCPDKLFKRYRTLFFESGIIDNLSAGIDFPPGVTENFEDDSLSKATDVWNALCWTKANFPNIDTHATITIHKLNLDYIPELVHNLSAGKVSINLNFIHWNKDGGYDFCANKEEIADLLFTEEDFLDVQNMLTEVLKAPGLIQNPEYLQAILDHPKLMLMGWHCMGDPYGGPTVDSDGRLRVCGYRKGEHTSKYSIFDLPEHIEVWQEAVYQDAMACPGCIWSCPVMFHYWKGKDPSMGKDVFTKHAGNHIPKENWNERKVQ